MCHTVWRADYTNCSTKPKDRKSAICVPTFPKYHARMFLLEILFWLCAICVAYSIAGYPLLLAVVGLFRNRPRSLAPFSGSVSIVLVVRNEEVTLERRLDELLQQLRHWGQPGEIVVVSDGSTDATVAIAQKCAQAGPVRVLDRPINTGKSAALTAGCLTCQSDVLVFADARQRWAPDALVHLLENFAEPAVGGVSGALHLETAPGVMAGVGVYWRYEKWIRRMESQIHSQVGVTGAICAVRRALFRPIPEGTLLDDVYWPLQVVLQGFRVVHDARACAFDRLSLHPRDEFRRKVRTLAGNFQMPLLLPAALVPWRNPVWVQWLSHKLLRLAVPWALMGMLLASFFLEGWFYQAAFWVQVAAYGLAVVGLTKPLGKMVPLAGAAASYLVLNAAAFVAFWIWISGRAGQSWHKITYQQE